MMYLEDFIQFYEQQYNNQYAFIGPTQTKIYSRLSAQLTKVSSFLNSRLATLINRTSSNSFQSLVSYVQIYITMQIHSQEFFNSFCQHQIVQKVFSSQLSNRDTLKILQLFNLILANTNQLNSIIYLFSQPALHAFLFERFNVQTQSPQAVEYYVQLLKTIIMKMSNGHSSLIKLFCNNRYSSFPMLFQITYLAVNAHQELVKITAQQCVLLLINLLNKKKVGCGYLSQIQMAIFFYELTLSISRSQKDLEGGLKYLVDLLVALQLNLISSKMLMNAFILNVIFKKIHRTCQVLEITRNFSQLMLDCQQFPQPLYLKIRLILSRIICNFCFNRFINSTYFTAIFKVGKGQSQTPLLNKEDQNIYSGLMKYFSTRFQKILPYIQQFDKNGELQNDLNAIMNGWLTFNGSKEVIAIKQNKQKSKSGFFGFFYSKPNPIESYLKVVTMYVGINYSSLKYPLFKLSATIDYSTAIFFVENSLVQNQIKLGANRMAGYQAYQVHFNDNRGCFQLNESFCSEILIMLQKVGRQNTGSQKQGQFIMEFQQNFLVRLKEYFRSSLSDHLLLIQHDYSTKQLSMLKRLLQVMRINEVIQKKTAQKLLWKLQQIQTQINELTFKTDFKSLISYVLYNQFESLVWKSKLKIKSRQSYDKIIKKMYKYEFIRELIDPQIQSLRSFILEKWTKYTSIEPNAQKLAFQKNDGSGRSIKIKSGDQIKLKILIKEGQNQEFCSHIDEQIIFQDINLEECIYFNEYPQGIHFKSKEDCAEFKQQWNKLAGLREEILTKWIVQFFEATHTSLCAAIANKKQQKNIYKSANSAYKY